MRVELGGCVRLRGGEAERLGDEARAASGRVHQAQQSAVGLDDLAAHVQPEPQPSTGAGRAVPGQFYGFWGADGLLYGERLAGSELDPMPGELFVREPRTGGTTSLEASGHFLCNVAGRALFGHFEPGDPVERPTFGLSSWASAGGARARRSRLAALGFRSQLMASAQQSMLRTAVAARERPV